MFVLRGRLGILEEEFVIILYVCIWIFFSDFFKSICKLLIRVIVRCKGKYLDVWGLLEIGLELILIFEWYCGL